MLQSQIEGTADRKKKIHEMQVTLTDANFLAAAALIALVALGQRSSAA